MEVSYQTGPAQIGAASGQAKPGAGKAIEHVSFIKGRLRRLEGRMQGGRCPECGQPPDGPGRIVVIDDGEPAEGFPDDPGERCERCGRPLWCVIHLLYDEEGEGARADA